MSIRSSTLIMLTITAATLDHLVRSVFWFETLCALAQVLATIVLLRMYRRAIERRAVRYGARQAIMRYRRREEMSHMTAIAPASPGND